MPAKDLSQARNYSLRLIKFRVRSEKEVRDKLKQKGFSPEVIDQAVDFLKKVQLLDDALFARLWVSSRIKKPLGARRLNYELKAKGIDKRIIEETLTEAQKEYGEEKAIADIIQLKLKKFKGLPREKIKARLYGLLLRRGYSAALVMDALEGALKEREEPDTAL